MSIDPVQFSQFYQNLADYLRIIWEIHQREVDSERVHLVVHPDIPAQPLDFASFELHFHPLYVEGLTRSTVDSFTKIATRFPEMLDGYPKELFTKIQGYGESIRGIEHREDEPYSIISFFEDAIPTATRSITTMVAARASYTVPYTIATGVKQLSATALRYSKVLDADLTHLLYMAQVPEMFLDGSPTGLDKSKVREQYVQGEKVLGCPVSKKVSEDCRAYLRERGYEYTETLTDRFVRLVDAHYTGMRDRFLDGGVSVSQSDQILFNGQLPIRKKASVEVVP